MTFTQLKMDGPEKCSGKVDGREFYATWSVKYKRFLMGAVGWPLLEPEPIAKALATELKRLGIPYGSPLQMVKTAV